jgi:hypothetical protein
MKLENPSISMPRGLTEDGLPIVCKLSDAIAASGACYEWHVFDLASPGSRRRPAIA